jgi:hypothetical protein
MLPKIISLRGFHFMDFRFATIPLRSNSLVFVFVATCSFHITEQTGCGGIDQQYLKVRPNVRPTDSLYFCVFTHVVVISQNKLATWGQPFGATLYFLV